MSKPNIQKVTSTEDRTLPIFAEFDDLLDRIRVRAYNLFRDRGFHEGRDLDDWLTAEKEYCWPAAELDEDDGEFEVKVALAGFEPEDITVTAGPRELIIKAARETKRGEPKKAGKSKVCWSEFRSNEVFRRIELPSDIDVDKIEAKFKQGLLEIEAPKATQKKKPAKKVKISAAK